MGKDGDMGEDSGEEPTKDHERPDQRDDQAEQTRPYHLNMNVWEERRTDWKPEGRRKRTTWRRRGDLWQNVDKWLVWRKGLIRRYNPDYLILMCFVYFIFSGRIYLCFVLANLFYGLILSVFGVPEKLVDWTNIAPTFDTRSFRDLVLPGSWVVGSGLWERIQPFLTIPCMPHWYIQFLLSISSIHHK